MNKIKYIILLTALSLNVVATSSQASIRVFRPNDDFEFSENDTRFDLINSEFQIQGERADDYRIRVGGRLKELPNKTYKMKDEKYQTVSLAEAKGRRGILDPLGRAGAPQFKMEWIEDSPASRALKSDLTRNRSGVIHPLPQNKRSKTKITGRQAIVNTYQTPNGVIPR
jgi:hypothetical protein